MTVSAEEPLAASRARRPGGRWLIEATALVAALAGFYNADSHYLFNMPGHHFVLAAAFKVLGAGILQARLVGVAYGVVVLLLTYLLGRRLYGAGVALLSVGLLLFLRLNMGF